jgi:hypothetical protein
MGAEVGYKAGTEYRFGHDPRRRQRAHQKQPRRRGKQLWSQKGWGRRLVLPETKRSEARTIVEEIEFHPHAKRVRGLIRRLIPN